MRPLLLATLCLAHLGWALTIDPLSLEALTAQSDLILQGTVRSKTCQRDSAGRIYTRVELEVAEVWKGALSGSPFQIMQGGGILGEQQSTVAGQASYELGEEVVAFLVRNERGEGVTLGLMQGKFGVRLDPGSGLKYVTHPFHEFTGTRDSALRAATGTAGRPARLSLAELRTRVDQAQR